MRKILLVVASVSLMSFGLVANAASSFRVGVVDMHKIMTDAPQMQKIKSDLESRFKPQENKLMSARDTLKADANKLRKDASILSKTERENLQKKVVSEQRGLQQQQMAFQQEVVKAQNIAVKDFVDSVKTITKKIAKKEHLNVVISNDTVIYFDNKYDITSQVLATLKKTNS